MACYPKTVLTGLGVMYVHYILEHQNIPETSKIIHLQLSNSSLHSCVSKGYLRRSISQEKVPVTLKRTKEIIVSVFLHYKKPLLR